MPELMEIRRTDYHSEVCVRTGYFTGSSWAPIDKWLSENTFVKINDDYITLAEGLRLWSIWPCPEDLVDAVTGHTLTEWYRKLHSIRFAESWDEVNEILKRTESCPNSMNPS